MVVLGVDPGSSGSLCLLNSKTKTALFYDTPGVDTPAVHVFNWILKNQPHRSALEDVHAIHGTSAGSNFKFGFNVGMLAAILGCTQLGYELIQPKVWQKAVGIRFKKGMTPPQKKKYVAAHALQLYPTANIHGPKGGLKDGRSDALMIAHYLVIKYGTTP